MYDTGCNQGVARQWDQKGVLLCKPIGGSNEFDKKEVYGDRYKLGINGGRNIIDCEPL